MTRGVRPGVAGGLRRLAVVWRRARVPCATCPAVPAALVLAAGIMAGVSWGARPTEGPRGLVWLVLGAAVAAGVSPWRAWRLACLPLGAALALLHERAPWDTLAHQVPRPACRLAVQAVVADAQCHGEALDLLPPPAAAVVDVRSLRLPGQRDWLGATGRAVLVLPEGCRLAYGDCVLAEGLLLPPSPPPFRQAFDYHSYLRHTGVRYTIRAEQVQVEGQAGGLVGAIRRLLSWRDLLAERLVAHIPSADNAGILLAMTFGFRQTLQPDVREAFLRSGTIHVFSVSGLHVAIVATVLGGALCLTAMPYRWRYAALPLLLGAYVVMTGSAPSAIRAWLMISAICLARACFLALSPLNGVALAALVLLLWNPFTLLQAGFLYSFTTVATLVLGWPLVSALARDLSERGLWLPRPLRPRLRLWAVRAAVRAVGSSLLAWFGGAGLMLYLSAMVVPAALPVNILLVLVANLLLVLAIPKMLLACLPVALPDLWAGHFMSAAVSAINALVHLGSSPAGSWSVAVPPAMVVVTYHVALFAVFLPRLPGAWRLVPLGLATAVLAAATWFPRQGPCTALVWGGDCDVPVVVVERGDGLPPIVVHSGTTEAHRALSDWLRQHGHRQVDALVFALDSHRAAETAPLAVRLLRAPTLVVPPDPRPGSHLYRACQDQLGMGGRVRLLAPVPPDRDESRADWPGGTVVHSAGDGFRRVEIVTRGHGPRQTLTIDRWPSGRCRVTLSAPGAPPQTIDVSPSFHRRVIPLDGAAPTPARPEAAG